MPRAGRPSRRRRRSTVLPHGAVAVTTAWPGLMPRTSPLLTVDHLRVVAAPFDGCRARSTLPVVVEQGRGQRRPARRGRRPTRVRSSASSPGTTWRRHTTGSKPRSRAVSVVVPVSRAVRVPVARSNRPPASCPPPSHAIRASGIGVLSAAWATAVNSRTRVTGPESARPSAWARPPASAGSRWTSNGARRSWPESAHDDLRPTGRPPGHHARRSPRRRRRCRPTATGCRPGPRGCSARAPGRTAFPRPRVPGPRSRRRSAMSAGSTSTGRWP